MSQAFSSRKNIRSRAADGSGWLRRAGGLARARSRSARLGFGLALLAACDGEESVTDPPTPSNRAPSVASALEAVTAEVGAAVVVDVSGHFTDPDGDALEYGASSSAPGVAAASVAGSEVTVTGVSSGTAEVTVTARDPGGLTASQAFTVTVPNRAPSVASGLEAVTAAVGAAVVVDVSGHFTDPDGDALEYGASSSAPDVATVSVAGSEVTVTGVSSGTAEVTVTARDPGGLTASQAFTVTVPNRAPSVASGLEAVTAAVGAAVVVDVSGHFTDPDGDALEYGASSSAPDVATVSVAGSEVTVTGVSSGTAEVTVTARDPGGLTASQAFTVTVPNRAPSVASALEAVTAEVGAAVVVDVSGHFTDPDGDALEYGASSSAPDVATASVAGSEVTVTGVSSGTAEVTVTARDPGGLTASQAFAVTVPNRAPSVASALEAVTAEVGAAVVVDVSGHFTDPDGDALEYGASSSAPDVATASVAVRR